MKCFLLRISPALLTAFLLVGTSGCSFTDNTSSSAEQPSKRGKSHGPADTENDLDRTGEADGDVVLIPKELTAKVVGVHDGDTVTVLDDTKRRYKIRLSGIDAPELGQDFGRRSKENLSRLIFGRGVVITHNKIDRWKRIVGKITADGTDANLRQIEGGMAWHFKRYEKEQPAAERAAYANAEADARTSRRGLWIQPNPEPPWNKRRR